MLALPFYTRLNIPKTPRENLEYRLKLHEKAARDRRFQEALREACARDPLLWLNTMCWLYEPRPEDGQDTTIPFVSWACQDVIYVGIRKHLGKRDIGIEKSRAQGASWLVLMLFLHEWMFSRRMLAFGLVSRNEDAVASADDPDSLFWKLDFQLSKQPRWMIPWFDPKRDRSIGDTSLVHPLTKSTIVGAAATKAAFRSGRKTAILWDEFATFPANSSEDALRSTQHVSKCRIALSTPESDQDTFYRIMHHPSSMLKVRLHWSHNPLHGAGLYTSDEKGNVVILDKDYDFPEDYEFVTAPKIGAKIRSPWYDNECSRLGVTPEAIAKELDIHYGGASYKWFGDIPERYLHKCEPPRLRGDIEFDPDLQVGQWVPIPGKGPFLLWTTLTPDGLPPVSQYVVACDVAAGGGSDYSSNSVLLIFDRNSGKQVGEWACHSIFPEDFALKAVSVCRWLARGGSPNAFLIWDAHGGTGTQFTNTVINRTKYRFIYRRGSESYKKVHGKVVTNVPGWVSHKPEVAMGDLRAAILRETLTIYSRNILAECSGWEHQKGKLVYVPSLTTKVDSAMGTSHGDRVTAAAMACQAFGSVNKLAPEAPPPAIPGPGVYDNDPGKLGHTGCMAYRLILHDQEKVNEDDFAWDEGEPQEDFERYAAAA